MHDTPNTSHTTDHDEGAAEEETNGSSTNVKAPFAPHEDDDSAFGDTDQHSTA